jgi:serine/threonine protein kinase
MIYELMYGRPPFMAKDPMEIFNMVLTSKILFPENFDSNGKSLIRHLCTHDLSKRYGLVAGGIATIKCHRFFNCIDWVNLQNKSLSND